MMPGFRISNLGDTWAWDSEYGFVELVSFHWEPIIAGLLGVLIYFLIRRRISAANQHLVCLTALLAVFVLLLSGIAIPKKWVFSYRSAPLDFIQKIPKVNAEAPEIVSVLAQNLPVKIPLLPSLKQKASPKHKAESRSWGELQSGYIADSQTQWQLAFIWITLPGIAFSLLLIAFSSWVCWFRFAFAKQLNEPMWNTTLHQVKGHLKVRQRVRLCYSSRCSAPAMVGFWMPKVMVPEAALGWDEARIRAVLFHEVAHIKRKDYLWQRIGRLVCALNWWNPAVWILFSKMRSCAENACDDLVIQTATAPEDYAEELVKIARDFKHRFFTSAEVGMLSSKKLSTRVEAILNRTLKRGGISRWGIAGVSVAIGIMVLGSMFALAKVPGNDPMWSERKLVELQDILDALEDAEKRFPAVRYTGQTIEEYRNEEDSTWGAQETPTKFQVWVGPGLDKFKYRIDFRPNRNRSDKTMWFDGKTHFTALGIKPSISMSVIENSTPEWERLPLFKELIHHQRDIRKNVQWALVGTSTLVGDMASINMTYEKYEGIEAVKLEVFQMGTLRNVWWLDPEKNYAMLGSETFGGRNGRHFRHKIEVKKHRDMGNGFWFPETVHYSQISFGKSQYRGVTKLMEIEKVPIGFKLAVFNKLEVIASLRAEKKSQMPKSVETSPEEWISSTTIILKDAQTRMPLGGKTVWFMLEGKFIREKTDSEGKFEVDLSKSKRPLKYLSVWARPEGYVGNSKFVTHDEASESIPKFLDFFLEPGNEISGRVVDHAGKGIKGAKIEFDFQGVRRWNQSANSGDDGKWTYPNAPKNLEGIRVRLSHSSYAQESVFSQFTTRTGQDLKALSDGNAILVIKNGHLISGRITNASGKPLPNAVVTLGFESRGANFATTISDANGHYELHKATNIIRNAEYHLSVQAKGFAPSLKGLPQIIGEKGIERDFVLEKGEKLSARLVDEEGNPVADVSVEINKWRDSRTLDFSIKTNHEGRFSWDSAPSDSVVFNFLKGEVKLRHVPLKATKDEQEIVFRPALILRGQVKDEKTGNPIPEFEVIVGRKMDSGPRPPWMDKEPQQWTDIDSVKLTGGQIELPFDTLGVTYRLQINAQGYEPLETKSFTAKSQTVQLKLELKRSRQ